MRRVKVRESSRWDEFILWRPCMSANDLPGSTQEVSRTVCLNTKMSPCSSLRLRGTRLKKPRERSLRSVLAALRTDQPLSTATRKLPPNIQNLHSAVIAAEWGAGPSSQNTKPTGNRPKRNQKWTKRDWRERREWWTQRDRPASVCRRRNRAAGKFLIALIHCTQLGSALSPLCAFISHCFCIDFFSSLSSKLDKGTENYTGVRVNGELSPRLLLFSRLIASRPSWFHMTFGIAFEP